MGLLDHGDALWCDPSHRHVLRALRQQTSQGTRADLQLQACQARRCGVHPSRALPLAVLRRLSIRSASTGYRRSSHFRTFGYRKCYIQSTTVARLPLHEHRKGIWGWWGCLGFHRSVRLIKRYLHRVPHNRPRFLEPGASFAFELTEKQGAALVTKCRTYREDAELEFAFEEYTKRYYNSWVAFARRARHGGDVKPVLVTGIDMTRDFAMIAYSNTGTHLSCEFNASVPLIGSANASVWGTWNVRGLVHTNSGPQLCSPPSPNAQDQDPSDANQVSVIPNEYNQCVFIRYYTMRRRAFLFPKVIKAGAGPHDLGSGNNHNETLPELTVQSGTDSDTVPGGSEDFKTDCSNSVTNYEPGLELFRNVSSVCRSRSLPLPLPVLTLSLSRRKKTVSISLGDTSLK